MPEMLDYDLAFDPALEPTSGDRACLRFCRARILRPARRSGAHTKPIMVPGRRPTSIHSPALFPMRRVRLDADGSHLDHREFSRSSRGADRLRCYPVGWGGTGPRQSLNFTPWGLIFSSVARIEERGAPTSDHYGRFSAGPPEPSRDPPISAIGRACYLCWQDNSGFQDPKKVCVADGVACHLDFNAPYRCSEPLRLAVSDLLKAVARWRHFAGSVPTFPAKCGHFR